MSTPTPENSKAGDIDLNVVLEMEEDIVYFDANSGRFFATLLEDERRLGWKISSKRHGALKVFDKAIAQGPSCSGINIVQLKKKQAPDLASYHNEERAVVPFNDKAVVCLTNRNPAEILDLGEARKFMIGPEDLRSTPRFRKTTPKGDDRLLTGGPVIKS